VLSDLKVTGGLKLTTTEVFRSLIGSITQQSLHDACTAWRLYCIMWRPLKIHSALFAIVSLHK